MDAIKSYFSKIMSQGHVMRKGSGKWKRDRSKEAGRFGKLPHRSVSTSHVDLDSRDPDMDDILMSSIRMFTPTFETFKSPQKVSDQRCFPREGIQRGRRDITRTPPPSKPPRRDLVFSVQLDTEGLNDIGVEIDCLTSSVDTSHHHKSPEEEPQSNKGDAEEEEYCCSAITASSNLDSSTTNLSRVPGLIFKVVALTQGSRCNLDGRVKVNDEIVDINGESLHKETRESARLLLQNAIKSGHVVLTIRRRRKRTTAAPIVPARQTSLLQSSHKIRSASSDDLCVAELSYASNSNGVSADPNSRARSLDDSVLAEPVSLEDANVDLNISSDDVFADSNTPYDKVTYVNLPHLRFHKNPHSHIKKNEFLPDLISNSTNKLDNTGNKSPASEDILCWSSKASADCSRPEFFLPREDNIFRESSSTSTLVEESDCKIESNSSSRKESVESIEYNTIHGGQKVSDGKSANVTAILQSAETKVQGHTENTQNSSGNITQHMSMSTHESESGLPSSPSCKKRLVSKLNLMKDEYGLGIHIAGGKDCKKGDMGIFVAAVTERGAADRDGRLKKGDELLMINGQSLIGITHQEAVEALRTSAPLVKLVVASKARKSLSIISPPIKLPESPRSISHEHKKVPPVDHKSKPKSCHQSKTDHTPSSGLESSVCHTSKSEITKRAPGKDQRAHIGHHNGGISSEVKLPEVVEQSLCGSALKCESAFEKCPPTRHSQPQSITIINGAGGKGLGFSVERGPSSSLGNLGVFVKEIFSPGLITQYGHLNKGDEILALNNQPLSSLTHEEVISLFRSLKQGPIKITFRPRTVPSRKSLKSSSNITSFDSLDGSPMSTPSQSPYTPARNKSNAQIKTKDGQNVLKLTNAVASFSNMHPERQVNNGEASKSFNPNAPSAVVRGGTDLSKVKNDFYVADKRSLQRESVLPPIPRASPKANDKGRVGVVTPLSNHSGNDFYQKNEHLSQVNPGQPQSVALSSKQVMKAPDSNSHSQKVISYGTQNMNSWTNNQLKPNQQIELEEMLQNCTELSSSLQPHSVVSSPKSSSVVKMQVKPVETHLAQSSPVMNLHSFKPSGIAVKYPPTDKDKRNSKQVFTTPIAKRKQYMENHNDKNTSSGNYTSEDGITRLAETRIHPAYQKIDSPTVRAKVSHSSHNASHNSVDRVDQQLHENRKQIDVSSPVIGQRRNCHSMLTPTKSLNEAQTDMFSAQAKTLPRLHHQSSTESSQHHVFNSTMVPQHEAAPEESLINEHEKMIHAASLPQKVTDGSVAPGCYSSLPRGHHHHHPCHQLPDHYQAYHNQHPSQYDTDSFMHNLRTSSTRDSFSQSTHPFSPKLLETELLLHDLMKPVYESQMPLKPFDDTALSFFNHNQAFARLSSTPKSLLSSDNNMTLSGYHSNLQDFNQSSDIQLAPDASFKSFTQASFYKYQSKEATATFHSNSASEKQSQSIYGNSQSFTNVKYPLSGTNSDPLTTSMFPLVKLPHMVSSKILTESAYGHLSSHNKHSQSIASALKNKTWDQDFSERYRFKVTVTKESGNTFGITVVRKTIGGVSSIYIQDVIPGSSVEKDNRLRKGDCLLSVNEVDLKDISLIDAHELFRNIAPGPVHITAIRDMARTAV